MMTNYSEFTPKQIDAAYINALVDLVNACRDWHIELDKIQHYENGWRVTFKRYSGDAICHDSSYGSPNYAPRFYPKITNLNDWSQTGPWETIGFPWDYGDVSVHDAEELAYYLHCLHNDMAPWEQNDENEDE